MNNEKNVNKTMEQKNIIFANRYKRNKIINEELQNKFKKLSVAVFGCGGLGGFVIEELARMGILKIYAIDIDVFSETNLNRQLFCDETNLGFEKTKIVYDRIRKVNSEVVIVPINENILDADAKKNILEKVMSSDLIIDCLDTIKYKIALEIICEKYNKVLIHGAIEDWIGQITTIFPGDKTLQKFYGYTSNENVIVEKKEKGNTSFTPAVVGSMEVSIAIKYFMGYFDNLYRGKILIIDLLNNDFDEVQI